MSNFPVEKKFIIDPVFLRFSLREFVESHMLMIRLLASKWQWCLLKQLSDELFHMNYVNKVQPPWDNFIVAKSGPSAQQKLPCGREVNSWSKSGSLAVALIFPVVQNNEQLRSVYWTQVY